MFKAVFAYELRYRLRRISTWVYFAGVFLTAFLAILGAGGVLGEGYVVLGDSSGKVYLNAPMTIHFVCSFWCYLGLIIIAAVMAGAVARDFEHGSYPLFFTRPVSKSAYLGGRFLGSMVVLVLIFSASALAIAFACLLPVYDKALIGPFRLIYFVWPYLTNVIPNIFLLGAFFFGLTILTRRLAPVYVAAVVFLLGYLAAANMSAMIEHRTMAALFDPLGMMAGMIASMRYWTIAEKNTRLMPIAGLFLLNRVVWLGLAAAFLAFSWSTFRFSQFAFQRKGRSAPRPELPHAPAPTGMMTAATGMMSAASGKAPEAGSPAAAPEVAARDFGRRARLGLFLRLARHEFGAIARSVYFQIILLCGVLFVLVNLKSVGRMYGTDLYPVTGRMLEDVHGMFGLFALIILTLYAGEAAWRERERKTAQILDAMPVPDWMSFGAKLAALMGIMALCELVTMGTSMLYQTFSGYFHYQVGLYLTDFFGLRMIDYWLLAVLALTVQSVVNNKYLGHFFMVGFYLMQAFLDQLGLQNKLYQYASDPGYSYSDMNGFGHFLAGYFSFKAYWSCFAVLLAVAAYLFWVRGVPAGARERLSMARARLRRPVVGLCAVAAALFVLTGGWIYDNTHVLNIFRTTFKEEERQAQYERLYKRHEKTPQPRIVDSQVRVELYPSRRSFTAAGRYVLKNKTGAQVDSLFLSIPQERLEIRSLALDPPGRVILGDPTHGFIAYALDHGLAPGDSMTLNFDVAYRCRGFRNSGSNTDIVYNGTFINNKDYLPSIGYLREQELTQDRIRKRHHLAPRERMASVDDAAAARDTYLGTDADWIRFACVVGTDADQMALAPGYLQREWTEHGRRYFSYTMDSPILDFYSFLSARWAVARDRWHDVAIEVYYNPSHRFNVDRMIAAVKASLDYYTRNYSPYQHRQLRIVEFPGYQTFAQSFPNTIPYSEAIGFIARVDEKKNDDVDYVTSVTAHEVAHQWWAHQVIGGNVQGATLMSETMAQYSALMVLRLLRGPAVARKYVRYELDNYLRGRSGERKKEMPLWLVEDQAYLHYFKGTVVMNAFCDYLGEERLNRALGEFCAAHRFEAPPFVTSPAFVACLRRATPDSVAYLVDDLLKTITLYDNKALSARCVRQADGRFKTTLTVLLKKTRADSLGGETPVAIHDLLPVGVFSASDSLLAVEKVWATRDTLIANLYTAQRPAKAGIDPDYVLVDKHPEDNLVSCGGAGKAAAKPAGRSGEVRVSVGAK